MSTTVRCGVVGASARAAVHSLARAGLAAWAVDLFGDRDLRLVSPSEVCPIAHYPEAIPTLTDGFPAGPVLYTGGLENHPRIVAALARKRELWGSPAEVLPQVRYPNRLSATLAAAGLKTPRVLSPSASCPATSLWLLKPLSSAAGLAIRFAVSGEIPDAEHYLQEFIPGESLSAVFVAEGSDVKCIGVTSQLIGIPWLHARRFKYAGNIGPVEIDAVCRDELNRIGRLLTAELGLRGVFGVDWIHHNGRPWVVEVNPRYPASVEVLEHARGASVFRYRPMPLPRGRNRTTVGKAIYYAPTRLVFPQTGPWDADLVPPFDPWRRPDFADIPAAGTRFETGSPVLTILAESSSPDMVRESLQSRAWELDRLFAELKP